MNEELENAKNLAQQIHEYKKKIDEMTKASKKLEQQLKDYMSSNAINEMESGPLLVTLKQYPETYIADTDALKAAGIFDKYSKIKAGYASLLIKEKK